MKKRLFVLQVVLLGLAILAFIAAIIQIINIADPVAKQVNRLPQNGRNEDFDPSLFRLNSIETVVNYCDSLYSQQYKNAALRDFERNYTELLASVISKRFYHGYSYYGLRTNYIASLFSKISVDGYRAIIIPDDILRYPLAACSQQSIVMMEVLKMKNIVSRKIGLQGKISGHFCFEVFYEGGWHFYDTNMEPDQRLLDSLNRPAAAQLFSDTSLLLRAYKNYPRTLILDVFSHYSYGEENEFPAPKGLLFQKITKVLSYVLWVLFLLAFLLVRRKYKKVINKEKCVE